MLYLFSFQMCVLSFRSGESPSIARPNEKGTPAGALTANTGDANTMAAKGDQEGGQPESTPEGSGEMAVLQRLDQVQGLIEAVLLRVAALEDGPSALALAQVLDGVKVPPVGR